MKAKGQLLRLFNVVRSCLQLVDIPVRKNELVLQKGSLVARKPDEKRARKRRWFIIST